MVTAAARRDIRVYSMGDYHLDGQSARPSLVLGYGALSEPAIESGIGVLARAVADASKVGYLPG